MRLILFVDSILKIVQTFLSDTTEYVHSFLIKYKAKTKT